MRFVCYADWGELPESVDDLFAEHELESIFFSKLWFENLVEHGLNKDQNLLLACVFEGEQAFALLPLSQEQEGHGHPLKHLYTSLYTPLIQSERQQETLSCLIEGLREHSIHSLQLDPVAEDDQNLQHFQQAMESSGYACHRYFRFYNWIHRPQGASFSDYMAARPAKVRNTIARKRRKLEREQDYSITLYTTHNIEQGFADYQTIYSASWKANEVFEPFVKGLAMRLAESGELRLAVLYINNQPAAAQFWFVTHGKASIFKLAYDEQWKQYSPGSILIAYLMEQVIDIDQVEEIDFLTGNDAYKQEWMSERRQRWRLSCIDQNPLPTKHSALTTILREALKRLQQKVYN